MENLQIVDNFLPKNFVIKENIYSFATHLLTVVHTSTIIKDKQFIK